MTSNSVQPLVSTGLAVHSAGVVVADELDFAKKQLSSIFPKFRKITADNNLGTTITPQTAGNTDVYFTIPSDTCWYPSKTKLRSVYTPTAGGAGNFNMIHANMPVFMNVCELYDDLNNYLQKTNNLNKATHIMAPWKATMSDYLQRSGPISSNQSADNSFAKDEMPGVPFASSSLSGYNPRWQKVNQGAAGATAYGKRSYISPLYLLVSLNNVAGPVINLNYKMSNICPNSVWSINKCLYYGPTRVLHVHFGLDQTTRYGFVSQVAASPSQQGIAALAGVGSFTNFWLEVAIESDINVIAMMKKRFFEHGLEYVVPYTKVIRPTLSGAQQTAQVQISRADGFALKEIYTSPYNVTEANSTAFDNSQITNVAVSNVDSFTNNDTYGAKLTSFHTEWNSVQIQPNELVLATMDDWRYNEEYLTGSSIDCVDSYYYNWSWAEIYDAHGPICRKEVSAVPFANLTGGLSLLDGAISLYNFVGTVPTGAINGYTPQNGLIYYLCVTTLKDLKINLESVYFA